MPKALIPRSLTSTLLILLLTAGCGTAETSDDGIPGPQNLPSISNATEGVPALVNEMRPGQCLNDTASLDTARRRLVLRCSSKHRIEIYDLITLPDRPALQAARDQENIDSCEASLAKRLASAPAPLSRDQLVLIAIDDYIEATGSGTSVACGVATRDFEQRVPLLFP